MYGQKSQPDAPKTAKCDDCGSNRLMYGRGKVTCTNCGKAIGATFNKYGRKKTDFKGITYDSKLEAEYAQDFDLRLQMGDIKAVERQVKIPLQAYGSHITNYFIDFVITHNDGHKEYCEIKGMETDLWKVKWKMLEAKLKIEEPDAEMTLFKQRSTKKVR